jgi:hypothetical protein
MLLAPEILKQADTRFPRPLGEGPGVRGKLVYGSLGRIHIGRVVFSAGGYGHPPFTE